MKKLLVIVGPTGIGKTDIAISLAKKFKGEIVSADSRQLYKGMDVGTGKTPQDQNSGPKIQKFEKYWLLDKIPIHLYDVIDPDETFSMAQYQQLAYEIIIKIHEKKKLPILVGGTGLYVQAVVEGLKIPKVKPDKELRKKLESKTLETLVQELDKVDPETSVKIDKQNPRRIIRALEVFYSTGESFSKLRSKFQSDFDSLQVGLNTDRSNLYKIADERVDRWFKQKFIEEVDELIGYGYKDSAGLLTLGYRQVAMYLDNRITLEEAIKRTKFEHHNYIRKQLTWFRKNGKIQWFDIQEEDSKSDIEKLVTDWLR